MARWHVSNDHLYKNIPVGACPRVLFTVGTRCICDLQHCPYMAKANRVAGYRFKNAVANKLCMSFPEKFYDYNAHQLLNVKQLQ